MRLLKRLRDGRHSEEEQEAIHEFVKFVGETLEPEKPRGEDKVHAG